MLKNGWRKEIRRRKKQFNFLRFSYFLKFLLLAFLFCSYEVEVKEVVDGDTFITYSGERVRLIGIDTPEEGRFYYNDSKNALKDLILGKKVRLEFDIVKKDVYDRILAYVFYDTLFVNDYMLKNGYSYIYTFPPNLKYFSKFKKSLDLAIKNKRGMWKNFYEEKEIFIGDPEKMEFHSKDCKEVYKIGDFNRIIFKSSKEALLEGFHPHKSCNPVKFFE
ncbi:MAG: thermonuclease family protein [Candidatus Hydrothermales bacterium]